jgi:hypothetical protein
MTDNVKLGGEAAVESVSPGENEVSDLLIVEISSEVSCSKEFAYTFSFK